MLWAGVALVVVAILAVAAWRLRQAADAGLAGKAALLGAEHQLQGRHLRAAGADLAASRAAFDRMHQAMAAPDPLLWLARVTPFLRVQVRTVDTIDAVGASVAGTGMRVVGAVSPLVATTNGHTLGATALGDLRRLRAELTPAAAALHQADVRLGALRRYRLVWPLNHLYDQVATRMNRIDGQATSAEQGLGALVAFMGASGPRRYLVLTQNPAEVRPTGGFIGTYGVLEADAGKVALVRYAPIESWYVPRPQAVVPAAQAPTAFQMPDPPVNQTLANVNAWPSWPKASRLALKLWAEGGEQPVNGTISFVPSFLARILAVTGPVSVPAYHETVTSADLVSRIDYYTHLEGAQAQIRAGVNRKEFLVDLGQAVFSRLLSAPASSWLPLAQAIGAGFDNREAMVWSTDPAVEQVLARRGWDGSLPGAPGDFFDDAEFEYTAKNGLGLRRTFDHVVQLRPDGSARLTTTLTIANTEPAAQTTGEALNVDSLSYITLYGPQGANLVRGSDRPEALEPPIAGHPAAGWLRAALPLGSTKLTSVWEAPAIAVRQPGGRWLYRIHWMHLAGHTGDVLHLHFELPRGWHWRGAPPPTTVPLDHDFVASFELSP